jgi:cholesterol transport system auxiliary component
MTRSSLTPARSEALAVGRRLCIVGLMIALSAGCSALRPAAVEQPYFYSLDGVRSEASATSPLAAPTLIINPPNSTSGFSSQRIVYVREAHQLEYYAHSEWIDSPARMLAPLITAVVGNSGAFRAVVTTPSAADGDLRLDTEIVRLQHELDVSPSRVRFTLRATLVDNKTRAVLAWREFDESVAATSETPYGGVLAANQAVQIVLEQLAHFCAETASHWAPTAGEH